MENMTVRTATLTDRGLTAAHGGTALLTSRATLAAKQIDGVPPMSAFRGAGSVPAYVADQESHPPRERSAG